jgi:serine/threonine-protein kinase RsbW
LRRRGKKTIGSPVQDGLGHAFVGDAQRGKDAAGEANVESATYSLNIPSELCMLSTARNFVESVGVCCGLAPSFVRSLVLVTGEAVTNIVRHAHRQVAAAQLQILFEIQADRVVLTFVDQGEPFDIRAVPHLEPGELRIGGRGVYLMRTLMDELSCQPRADQQPGNRLQMVKRIESGNWSRECG